MAITTTTPTIANTATTTELKTLTIKEFAQANNFVSINKSVAVNTNKYPFLTFINAKNEAENIYFAKTIADEYPEGTVMTKEHFSALQIGITNNAEGEERIKLIPIGGNRLSLDSLLD